MDSSLQLLIEMSEFTLSAFKKGLQDVTPEEVDWRPTPDANSINLILRHLRLEAEDHLVKIEGREPPEAVVPPLDFEQNLRDLEDLYTRFIAALRQTTLAGLEKQTAFVYQKSPRRGSLPPHFLGFHQTVHLVGHLGQIGAIRNLYRKKCGKPGLLPNNPMFPP